MEDNISKMIKDFFKVRLITICQYKRNFEETIYSRLNMQLNFYLLLNFIFKMCKSNGLRSVRFNDSILLNLLNYPQNNIVLWVFLIIL